MENSEMNNETQCKRFKKNEENKRNRIGNESVIAPSGIESSSEIFKLIDDCFEQLFDLLHLKDLLILRRTCKQMKQIVDYYITFNHRKLKFLYICGNYGTIYGWHRSDFCYKRLSHYDWIRHLHIIDFSNDITAGIDSIKYILNQLDTLRLYPSIGIYGELHGEFYEVFLQHCSRLKYLGLKVRDIERTIIGTGNEWLLRRYPTLEHFEVILTIYPEVSIEKTDILTKLLIFFELNPNIRAFGTNYLFLNNARHIMTGWNIKFDCFRIDVDHRLDFICDLANDFYKHGFYEQLHLLTLEDRYTRNSLNTISKFCNLEKVVFQHKHENFNFSEMGSIRELSIFNCRLPNPTFFKTKFINLKRIRLSKCNYSYIWYLVCNAPKLQQILLPNRDYDVHFTSHRLIDWNAAREKLDRASKVTIFVEEDLFLKYKWTPLPEFSLIELKSIESCKINYSSNSPIAMCSGNQFI